MSGAESGAMTEEHKSGEESNTTAVKEAFTLFKSYLEDKLGQKEKQMDTRVRTESKIAQMKFKGNQKQYEHNAKLDEILGKILVENSSKNTTIDELVKEGKDIIRKRQKLIQIADQNVDGWKVVDEYISDDLASNSEDEKRLKKAKNAASRKRRQAGDKHKYYGNANKRFKERLPSSEQQFFPGTIIERLQSFVKLKFVGEITNV